MLTGVVKNGGIPVAGARVEAITGSSGGEAASTDGVGRYRLSLPSGAIRIRVIGDGYFSEFRDVVINGDSTRDFQLQPIVNLSAGAAVTSTISGIGTADYPTCFTPGEDGYEDSPCRKFLFAAVEDGTLDAIMRSPSQWSAVDVIAPDGSTSSAIGSGGRRVSTLMRAGLSYEIRLINFGKASGEFDLRIEVRR